MSQKKPPLRTEDAIPNETTFRVGQMKATLTLCGINSENLSNEALVDVYAFVRLVLHMVVKEAACISQHSCRQMMCIRDMLLSARTHAPGYTPLNIHVAPMYRTLQTGNSLHFYREYPEVDLNFFDDAVDIFDVKIRCHWLCFQGIMCKTDENVLTEALDDKKPLAIELDQSNTAEAEGESQAVQLRPSAEFLEAASQTLQQEHVVVRQVLSSNVSLEKQQFYKSIMAACIGTDDRARSSALHSLEVDTSLQDILPVLSLTIFHGIRANVAQKCISLLIYLNRVIRVLSINKSVNLAPVLHQIIPSLLTCCTGNTLCTNPMTDHHWTLRDFAAKTLIIVMRDYGKRFPAVRNRLIAFLSGIFNNPSAPLCMVYGTIQLLGDIATVDEKKQQFMKTYDSLMKRCSDAMAQPPAPIELTKLHAVLNKYMKNSMEKIKSQSAVIEEI